MARPAADHVGHRHRLRSDEPHRGTDGRRNDFVDGPDARRHPALYALVKPGGSSSAPAQRTRTASGCGAKPRRASDDALPLLCHFFNQGITMNTNLNSSRRFASALLLGLVLAGGASAQTASPADPFPAGRGCPDEGRLRGLWPPTTTNRPPRPFHRSAAPQDGQDFQAMVASGRAAPACLPTAMRLPQRTKALRRTTTPWLRSYRQLAAKAQP